MVNENGVGHSSQDEDDEHFADEEERAQIEWLQQQLAAHMEGGHGEGEEEDNWVDPTGGRLMRLIEAAETNEVEQVQALLEEGDFDVNLPGPDGDTPLHVAALFGSAQIVQLLLSHGAHPDARNVNDGSLAHHDAAASGHLDILQMLTEFSGPEALSVADSDGENPLHTAARGNHLEIVRWLLERGACPKAKNSEGKTAADEADEQAVVDLINSFQQ